MITTKEKMRRYTARNAVVGDIVGQRTRTAKLRRVLEVLADGSLLTEGLDSHRRSTIAAKSLHMYAIVDIIRCRVDDDGTITELP